MEENLIKPIFDDALLKESDDDVDFIIYLHIKEGRIIGYGNKERTWHRALRNISSYRVFLALTKID